MRAQAAEAIATIDALSDWQHHTRQLLIDANIRGVATRIAEDLIGYPMLTAPTVAERYDLTNQGANDALRRLEQVGILDQRRGPGRSRLYQCVDVMRIVNQ